MASEDAIRLLVALLADFALLLGFDAAGVLAGFAFLGGLVAAGTFGAPTTEWVPGYPLQYNLLRISNDRVVVETRRREEPNGAWQPDARWLQGPGKDPLPRYEMVLSTELP